MWDKLAVDRPILRELSEEDGILYELDNITGQVFDRQISDCSLTSELWKRASRT